MAELLAILGPTASGKSDLALDLAERLGAEIITCDSAQVFTGLDVATAKPSAADRARVPHHLLDQIPPSSQWTAATFRRHADAAVADIRARGRVPILCGGTGLWYRALIHGIFEAPDIDPDIRASVRRDLEERGAASLHRRLRDVDPEAAARISSGDPQRIGRALEFWLQTGEPISRHQQAHGFQQRRYDVRAVALAWPRDALWRRIEARTDRMYEQGLVEEVGRVLAGGCPPGAPGLRIIGARDAVRVVQGKWTVRQARDATVIATRQFAKRQRNWFNHEPTVTWVDAAGGPERRRELVLDRLGRTA
jgi:tRNA dimethylallyltransferase